MAKTTNPQFLTERQVMLRKAQLTGLLERICRDLELSEAQREKAREHYDAVSTWLAESPSLATSSIYPQGSIAIGTTVKPLGRDEYDLDLVCLNIGTKADLRPAELKRVIGDRLRENSNYARMLSEKERCWRLNYAHEFHMDITPSIPNPTCVQGGELVPDKSLQTWKPSNPKGYRDWFEKRAALLPRLLIQEAAFAEARAEIEALPGPVAFRGLLKRAVQLFKRHRDVMFAESDRQEQAPISIILTTLAAKSYEHCVSTGTYGTELDVVFDTLKTMPSFVRISEIGGRTHFEVPNETTAGENFAEKWNDDPARAKTFFSWQQKALKDFENLPTTMGLDLIQNELGLTFGETVAGRAVSEFTDAFSNARKERRLSVSKNVGLATGAAQGVVVRPNRFYGR